MASLSSTTRSPSSAATLSSAAPPYVEPTNIEASESTYSLDVNNRVLLKLKFYCHLSYHIASK